MRNNLSVSALSEFTNEIRTASEEADISYGVHLTWETGTRMQVDAMPMCVGPHRVSRSFSWKTDEPRQLLGGNHGPNPQELLLSGLGACILVAFVVGATARGVQLDSLGIHVDGALDLSGFLGLGEDDAVGFPEITYRLQVASDASAEVLAEIHQNAVKHSPNAMTVSRPVALKGELEITETD